MVWRNQTTRLAFCFGVRAFISETDVKCLTFLSLCFGCQNYFVTLKPSVYLQWVFSGQIEELRGRGLSVHSAAFRLSVGIATWPFCVTKGCGGSVKSQLTQCTAPLVLIFPIFLQCWRKPRFRTEQWQRSTGPGEGCTDSPRHLTHDVLRLSQ